MPELNLSNLRPAKGAKTSRKRVGRGWASKGKYSGRGVKGQRSRSGGKSGLKKRGLKSIMMNIPKKRGFKSGRPEAEVVNLSKINSNFSDGVVVSPKALIAKNLISGTKGGVKILGNGELSFKITVKGCQVSASAKEKIEKAGGSVSAE